MTGAEIRSRERDWAQLPALQSTGRYIAKERGGEGSVDGE